VPANSATVTVSFRWFTGGFGPRVGFVVQNSEVDSTPLLDGVFYGSRAAWRRPAADGRRSATARSGRPRRSQRLPRPSQHAPHRVLANGFVGECLGVAVGEIEADPDDR
jgi:hypothetical protein